MSSHPQWSRVAWVAILGVLWSPMIARAGNSEEVNAGLDVTLTGGAVVANDYTGASLWYNPAGLARSDKPSLELSGVTLNMQIVKNPGLLTIDSDPQTGSAGSGFNFTVIPQAITFSLKLNDAGSQLFTIWNGAFTDPQTSDVFGNTSFMHLHLPEEERRE